MRAVCVLSRVWLCVTPWTIARQAPLSMGLSRKEYCSGLSFPPPGDCPDPGMEPASPELAGRFFTIDPPGKRGIVVCSILLCGHTTFYFSIFLSMDIGLFLVLCYYHLCCYENCKGRWIFFQIFLYSWCFLFLWNTWFTFFCFSIVYSVFKKSDS